MKSVAMKPVTEDGLRPTFCTHREEDGRDYKFFLLVCYRAFWFPAGGVGGHCAGCFSRLLVTCHGTPEQTCAQLPFISFGDL